MKASAHVDTFARDHLPPRDQWPDLVFTLPELRYPDELNCATELLDRALERGGGARAAIVSPGGTRWTYADLTAPALHGPPMAPLAIATNLLGMAPGPFVTGLLADRIGLASALQLLPLAGIAAALALLVGVRNYRNDLERVSPQPCS